MQLNLRRMFRDAGITLGRQYAGALMQLGVILLIARELGPEGAGGYAVALLVPQILSQLLNLGMAPANVYFLASRRFDLGQMWPCLRDVSITIIVLGLGVGLTLVSLLGKAAFPGIELALLTLALGIFPFSFAVVMVQSLFQAMQDFRTYNLLVLVQPVTALLMLTSLWIADNFALWSVIVATAIAHLIALIIGLSALSRHTPLWVKTVDHSLYLYPAIRYGIKAHLGNIAAFLNYRLDLFLVNLFLGPTAAGLYSVAVRLVEQLWIVSQAVSTVILPRFASLRGDEATLRALTPLIARFVLWITIFGAAALAVLALPLIVLLFGADFSGATVALFLLLPGVVMLSSARVMANDLAGRGLVGINLLLAVVILVINALGNLILIPLYGIAGAATATSLANVGLLVLNLIIHQRITGTSWWQILVPLPADFRLLKRFFSRGDVE